MSRSPGASRDGIVVEGRGLVAGNKVLDRATYDFVSVQRSDPSTIVHVGGRFPPEIQDIYRSELQRIIDSLKPPGTDPFTGRCL
jgi:hypothetical protein